MKTKRLLAMLLTLVMLMTGVIAAPVSAEAKTKKPAATVITKVTTGNNSATIKWTKKTGIKGYQLQYSTNAKFTKKTKKTVKIKKASTTKYTIYKLKPNKKYYFRIRTYKVTKGTTVYSKWSPVKSKKTKTSGTTNPGNNDGNSSNNGETTENDPLPETSTYVDPSTCNHKWVTIDSTPATYENEGYIMKCCSKCYTAKREILPKLTFTPDLNTSHYDAWKVTDKNNANVTDTEHLGYHTKYCENYCKNNNLTPTLQYVQNQWIILESQQERPASSQHTWCTVCECDIENRFFHDRYYYYNYPNSKEARRFDAFWNAYGGPYVFAEYTISTSYITYDAYIHMCERFNNGNLIIINQGENTPRTMDDWFKTKYNHRLSEYGIYVWTGNFGWFYENGQWTGQKSDGTYANRIAYLELDTNSYPLPSNINKNDVQAYWENPTGWTWTEPYISGKYTGYVWECPHCHGIVPAYHKDDHSMAGAITQYKKTTVTYTPVYEWTNEWCVKKTTGAIDKNQTNIANYKSTFHIVDGRLGEDGQYRK